jgi:hypothetical protein
MKKKITMKYKSQNLGFMKDGTQETFNPIILYGTETETEMGKQKLPGNYIMENFKIFILYQVKIRKGMG